MYGTLSFDKNEDSSPTEFYAFSSIRGRRQRQPACDECRRARVKCREKFSKDKCARCHSTRRTCTYSSNQHAPRQSNQSGKDEPPRSNRPANVIGKKTVQDGDSHPAISPTPPRALSPIPGGQNDFVGRENIFDFQLDNIDIVGDLSGSPSTAATSRDMANRQAEDEVDDMGSLFGFINDTCVMSHVPDMISTSEYIDERSIGDHSSSDRALSTVTLSSALNISRSTPHGQDGRAKTLETPLETPLHQSWTLRHSRSTQDKLPARLSPLTGFHDVIDVVRFLKALPYPTRQPRSRAYAHASKT
ncbi:hypothetical protein K456DRAFT_1938116 [Colletotrichum gloeosporioides 23]|nr:hypothetical protein K456DRAFT_1938116 [Colletotrichum gloeosporioides 23]